MKFDFKTQRSAQKLMNRIKFIVAIESSNE